uniref:Uncharacterized protein n=1 Tax=Romanomermis culicivorax TaxID=13658 RepID=A0A915KIQ8_ROMCU
MPCRFSTLFLLFFIFFSNYDQGFSKRGGGSRLGGSFGRLFKVGSSKGRLGSSNVRFGRDPFINKGVKSLPLWATILLIIGVFLSIVGFICFLANQTYEDYDRSMGTREENERLDREAALLPKVPPVDESLELMTSTMKNDFEPPQRLQDIKLHSRPV